MSTKVENISFVGIIPARYGSTRFPGKPLIDIAGKTMIQRVYEQASKAMDIVIVATDDDRIKNNVTDFGGIAVMTSVNHTSGTDRCAEAASAYIKKSIKKQDNKIVIINIQGDEPFIQPEQLKTLMTCFSEQETQIATLVKEITETDDIFNKNKPKVVINTNSEAIYFSRSPIPFVRSAEETEWVNKHIFYKHIGIYGYRYDILKEITNIPPSSLEKAESLEQNRWLENGYKIKTAVTKLECASIDTEDDLKKVNLLFS